MISLILYAALGFALGVGGISVVNKPLEFIIILMIVIAIDNCR